MSHEQTFDDWEDFLSEWGNPDHYNIPVRAYWWKDESEFTIEFAHPRKLTMSSVTVNGASLEVVKEWILKHRPKLLEVSEL